MPDSLVVDTNVLIVASAADNSSPFQPEATPVEEQALRDRVLAWVKTFEQDPDCHVVLDYDWHICSEYLRKLDQNQDYGWLAMMRKQDRNEVVWVGFDVDANGHATLPTGLRGAVTDLEDRKMVAAVLAAKAQGRDTELVNACDTDWLDCKRALDAAGIRVQHLLEEWLTRRHTSKKKRGG